MHKSQKVNRKSNTKQMEGSNNQIENKLAKQKTEWTE